MSRNDAGSPPIAHFDLATRLIHLALVAFGVPAARIHLVPAAADSEQLILEFSANGETAP